MTFAEFAAETVRRPWQWGVQDCTIWVADWCVLRWGVDPAADLRGTYHTEAEALKLTDCGLYKLILPRMDFARPKADADEGDVGLIHVNGRETSAIRSGGKWAFRTRRGIGFVNGPAGFVWG